jgi:xanthine/uracil permease
MKHRIQSDTWIFRTILVLGVLLMMSFIAVITSLVMGQSMPKLLAALGVVAIAGLIQLLISPLNQHLSQ